ncbi:MAG: HAMP domain-containing histidine kinase [Saprospiraceae bacterium]|nr:HAMP domain-containing histidine kinase [Saprospiraceae bacterium]
MILDRKQLWILWIGLGLLIAAFIWDAVFSGERNIYRYRDTIQNYLQTQEKVVDEIMNDSGFVIRRMNTIMVGSAFKDDVQRIERLQQQPFNFCIFKGDSAIFWTRNDVLPLKSDCAIGDTVLGFTYSKLVEIKLSQYELRYRTARNTSEPDETVLLAALIPIKRVYGSFEGKFLESHYLASPLIPTSMDLLEGAKNKFSVQTQEGKTLCSLTLDLKNEADRLHDIGMVILLALGFFLLGMFGDRIAKQMLAQNELPMMGITFFIGTLIALRACILFIEGSNLLPTTDLQLTPYSNAVFMHSLPELIINTIFLFWLAVFFNKEFRLPDFKQQPLWIKWSLAVGCYTILVSLNILSVGTYNDLVTSWNNIMTFESLTDFNGQTIVTILSLSLIQLSVFLISHRLIISVKELALKNWQMFFAQVSAMGIGAMLYNIYQFTSSLPTIGYIAILFVYITIFHKFIQYKKSNISWLVIWIVIFSALQAFFISRLSIDKETQNLYSHAKNLASERDAIAEGHIKFLADTIMSDPWIKTTTILPFRVSVDPAHIEKRIKLFFNTDDYLSDHYSLRFSGINKTGEAVINPDSIDLRELQQQFSQSVPLAKEDKCNFWTDTKGKNAYLSRAILPVRKENPLYIWMQFSRVDKMSSRIFTEILADKHYKRIPQLNEYSYAIYKNNVLFEQNQQGTFERTLSRSKIPPPKSTIHEIVDNQDQITYQNEQGIVVRIRKYIPLSSQGFTLFIYFILVLTIILLILTFINHFYPFLPEIVSMSYRNSTNASLRYRIMIPVILFILLSYAVVFAFTFSYYKKVGDKFFTSEFENKAKTIMKNLRKDFQDNIVSDKDLINSCLSRNSDSYEMAMHFYNTEGVLGATTETNIFDKGILAPRMNPTAYMKLRLGLEDEFRTDENIGKFHYKSSFYTLRDGNNHILGFIELPFYSRDRNLRLSASDMWSYSAGVLTLLFILCISIISMQTQRLIEPLQQVADTLRRLRVGKTVKNEIIPWNKKDEIGALINAYNAKVSELEEAIIRLAEAEREGAWRDMARQVAHEIRNPLTPMKLVVQHLEMMRLHGNDNLQEYTLRSNRVLLEQIASLEKIVNEFHSFARMPNKATNVNFPLNELVQSVADLFAQHNDEGKPIQVNLSMPTETYIVYADRALLTSAFNNLLKNAIQAIPPDREGLVNIKLYREENTAIVKISDNGLGIPKDIQDKIFSPNFTTKAYGSGIGLLITKNIIQSVNGTITFDSVENEGTDFYVQLDISESIKNEEEPTVSDVNS